MIKRFKPETKFILSGHFGQFLPVKDRIGEQNESYYKNSEIFHELTNSNIVLLSTCRRADEKHFKLCSDSDNVKASDYNNEFCDLHICYTNKKRIKLNRIMMDKQIEYQKFLARKNKKKYKEPLHLPKNMFSSNSQSVDLFVSTPVIAISNLKGQYVNGEKFIIDNINCTTMILKNDRRLVEIPIKNFQRHFHVAYAITSHKSQGQTFNVPYTIHEWSRLNNRSKYVSLTRSDSWENCNIIDQ
jgi:hypothetical protein